MITQLEINFPINIRNNILYFIIEKYIETLEFTTCPHRPYGYWAEFSNVSDRFYLEVEEVLDTEEDI